MSTKKNASIEVLRIAVDEQRREYDELTAMKNSVGIKTLTLTGAGLALLAFLYGDGSLFFPEELYGRVFYIIGAFLTVGATCTLLYATKPSGRWEFPPELTDLEELSEDDEREYLEYVKRRYISCWKHNSKHYSLKQKLMNMSFYPLVFGAIILVSIKIFGGQ